MKRALLSVWSLTFALCAAACWLGAQAPTSISGLPSLAGAANIVSASVGNTADTNEDNLMSVTIPSGTLLVANTGLRVRAWGTCAANTDTKTIRWYLDATAISGTAPTCNNVSWALDLSILAKTATTQTTISNLFVSTGTAATNTVATSVTVTAASVIKITAQASVANANDVVQTGMIVTPF